VRTTRRNSGFTLVELMLASALAAVMLGGVLTVLTVVARDRQRLAAGAAAGGGGDGAERVLALLRRDLTHARTFQQPSPRGKVLLLEGYGGINADTLLPDGRLCRVEYRIEELDAKRWLFRRQRYLDDRTHPQPWTAVVSSEVQRIFVDEVVTQVKPATARPATAPATAPSAATLSPRIRLRIALSGGVSADKELVLR
jgi:prepilin-type N-terminal cleavage/methylation domain-containing protein